MNKKIRICIVFLYSDCLIIYHYANLTAPNNVDNSKLEHAFNGMYDSFTDENYYCREDDGISDGEFLVKKVCEKNNWKYSNFLKEEVIEARDCGYEYSSKALAKRLGIEPADFVLTIFDG